MFLSYLTGFIPVMSHWFDPGHTQTQVQAQRALRYLQVMLGCYQAYFAIQSCLKGKRQPFTLLSSWYDRHIKRLFKRTLIIYHKCWLMQKNVHKTGWSLSDAYWCHALVQKLYLLIRDPALSLVCLLSIDYISPCSWRLSVRLFITVLPHLEFISFFFHICFDLSQKAETNSCVPLHESSPSQFSSKSVCLFVICSINI